MPTTSIIITSIYSRLEQQAAASRREFDLYDPESKKKDKPARVSDDDPRCQVSGLQLFQGEFMSYDRDPEGSHFLISSAKFC